MKKRLISPHNVDEFICDQDRTIYVQTDMILSPGAKDVLRNRGISICFGPRPKTQLTEAVPVPDVPVLDSTPCSAQNQTCDSEAGIVARIIQLLNEEYNITDPEQLEQISLEVMKKIKQSK
jgi:hypothetical protein